MKENESIMDKLKGDMMIGMIEEALPKITPFLAPAIEKMNEWFGDDEKVVVIRKIKGQPAKVIVLKNNIKNAGYEIKKSDKENVFSADKEVVGDVFNIEEFVQKMMTGDLFKKD